MSDRETSSSLRADGASRVFGSLVALDNVSVEFKPGKVHAVVGENGAGKSTLMNILGGFLTPSSGTLSLNGHPLPSNPQRCRAMGIEMVHQHFKLVPAFTIRENLRLSQLGIGKSGIQEIEDRAKEFDWTIPWDSRVRDVSVGIQQRVEILKCVATNPKVLIFDEPTAVLSESEVDDLIQFMRRLASEGKIVILIAHKIEEVLAAADTITVLRKGLLIGTVERASISSDQLIDMMVGEQVLRKESRVTKANRREGDFSAEDLWVKDDRGIQAVRGVTFGVSKGEILGIGGVDGNGQVELAEALAGIRPAISGSIKGDLTVGYVPQDRQTDGLALSLNLTENIAIAAVTRGEPFQPEAQTEKAKKLIQQFNIKARSERDKAIQLSGGNQQKVVLARVLDLDPRVLIVVNPTRGLDVKAAAFIHEQIRNAAKNGACVIVFTTDRDELFELTDSQWFMSRGDLYDDEREALAS